MKSELNYQQFICLFRLQFNGLEEQADLITLETWYIEKPRFHHSLLGEHKFIYRAHRVTVDMALPPVPKTSAFWTIGQPLRAPFFNSSC
jgi:hypothetical protein